MKKLVLMLPLLFLGTFLFSQVKGGILHMSQGSKDALSVYLEKTNKKEVEEAWTKYLKQYKGKTKKNKKTGEIFSDDAEIKEMSNNTVDVYAAVMEKGEDTELQVWFDLGGAYLSSTAHPDRYPVAIELLEEFQVMVSRAAMEEEIKNQEDLLKKMNGDLNDLEKEESNLVADIDKYNKKIEEAKQKIQEAQAAQQVKQGEIKAQEVLIKDLVGRLSGIK